MNRGGPSDAIVPPLPAERLDRPRPRGKHQLLDSQRGQLHDCIRQLVQKSAGTARPNWAQNIAVLRASEGGDEAADVDYPDNLPCCKLIDAEFKRNKFIGP